MWEKLNLSCRPMIFMSKPRNDKLNKCTMKAEVQSCGWGEDAEQTNHITPNIKGI